MICVWRLRVPPTLGLARSKSRFCYHVKELTQTNSYIPENRSNSVLSGRQRPLNVEKTAFRRSQFRPIKWHGVENFFVSGCSLDSRLQDTYLQNPLSARLWPPDAVFPRIFDFFDPKILQMCQFGNFADGVGQFSLQIRKADVLMVSNLEKN